MLEVGSIYNADNVPGASFALYKEECFYNPDNYTRFVLSIEKFNYLKSRNFIFLDGKAIKIAGSAPYKALKILIDDKIFCMITRIDFPIEKFKKVI